MPVFRIAQCSKSNTVKAGSCLVGREDEKEEKELLSQAIALSEENEEEDDEEELLRQAIALSLED